MEEKPGTAEQSDALTELDLAEQQHVKDNQVLAREGLENELMASERSEAGEEISDVE